MERLTGWANTTTGDCDPLCGNGTCDTTEDCASCAADCACPTGQACNTTTGDCESTSVCDNDGTCDAGETTANCPADCPAGADGGADDMGANEVEEVESGGGCDCDVGGSASRGSVLGLLGLAFLGLIARRRRA